MPRPRLQFRLSTLIWLTLAVECSLGGMVFERWLVKRKEAEMRALERAMNPPVPLCGHPDFGSNADELTAQEDGTPESSLPTSNALDARDEESQAGSRADEPDGGS
jgi:hypothetical protein